MDEQQADDIDDYTIRPPIPEDAVGVHDLIAACPPLDTNSLYANLLQCSHFSDTCALAANSAEKPKIHGWVSGYVIPHEPDVFFLWQVAIAKEARGKRVPKRLVSEILNRAATKNCRYLKTTITADNQASWHLFESLARWLEAPLTKSDGFEEAAHFNGRHDSELLVTIGPFGRPPPVA